MTPEDALDVVRLLDDTSVDLIDVSGGTYFPGAASSSDGTSSSGAYFAEFAAQAKKITSIPIALTGGFETRAQVVQALQDGSADAVSLGRAMILDPALAQTWFSDKGGDPAFPVFEAPPRGSVTAWYSMRLTAIGEDNEEGFDLRSSDALEAYEARDAARCEIWRARFG